MLELIFRKAAFRMYLLVFRTYLPGGEWLRARLFRAMTGNKAVGVVVRPGVYIAGATLLNVGRNLSLNHNCFISAEGGLSIGNDVAVGHGTSILTTEHGFAVDSIPIKHQPVSKHPVSIGDGVWIGANVTVLGGIRIADGCVIGAGSVVTRDVLVEDAIFAGIPARMIGSRRR